MVHARSHTPDLLMTSPLQSQPFIQGSPHEPTTSSFLSSSLIASDRSRQEQTGYER